MMKKYTGNFFFRLISNLFFWFFVCSFPLLNAKPFIDAEIRGQLGNHLFIVAAASALAWDNGCEAYFPELQTKYGGPPKNHFQNLSNVFFRCTLSEPGEEASSHWNEPSFFYTKIPYKKNIKLHGYFQSEKYFSHHRDKILELYAPHPDDLKYIQTKYSWLIKHPNTVAVHIRKYFEDQNGWRFIQYGKNYLRKAMQLFPDDAQFILFSNDMNFAKDNIPEEMAARVICIENESHVVDLHLISLCKHAIISNSTFAWWGAWLNKNPKKTVIAPAQWLHPEDSYDSRDLFPKKWIQIPAKWGRVSDPTTYQ